MSLELIFSCERERMATKKDAVVCAIHSALLSAGLKCVGCGEQLVVTEETRGSDMMPNGWNSGTGVYVIHYRNESSKEKVYMLKALAVDNSLFIQLMRTSDERISEMDLNTDDYITDNLADFSGAYRDVDGLVNTLRTQLINPVLTAPPPSSSSSTRSSDRTNTGGGVPDHGRYGDPLMGSRPDPLRGDPLRGDPLRTDPLWGDPLRADPLRADPYGGGIPNPNAPRIGNTDLDPFGRGQAGMVFDPFRTGGGMPGMFGPPGTGPGLPPRGFMPGSRYDPVGPPGIDPLSGGFRGGFGGQSGPHGGPDPDHMRPPDFSDSMYM